MVKYFMINQQLIYQIYLYLPLTLNNSIHTMILSIRQISPLRAGKALFFCLIKSLVMKRIAVLSCLLLLNIPFFKVWSQNPSGFQLKGQLLNEKGEAVAEELISVFRSVDTLLIKNEITDTQGNYTFENLPEGTYRIGAKIVGFQPYLGDAFQVSENKTLPAIVMLLVSKDLEEVAVMQKKPYLERGPGRFILNIENSIQSTGSSAFEIIEKAPGVQVSSNDEIRLRGRAGVMVQVNGKNIPMTGSDLANYLRGISSSAIEKIEFITNPTAKQDAAGSSIINIKLKKDSRLGTNGTLSLSYGQGVYPKTGESISLNHRNKKWNVYGSYNFAYRKAFNHLVLERRFYEQDTFKGAYIQDNYLTFPFKNHIARAGVDYTIDNKSTISLVVNGISNRFNPGGKNVSLVQNEQQQVNSSFETTNRSFDNWYNYSTNLNYTRALDTLGSQFTADADYAHYANRTEQNFETNFYDLNHQQTSIPYLLYGDLKGDLAIHSLKADYTKAFKNQNSLEAGAKSSYVIADNNLKFFDRSMGADNYDSTKSNHFIYKENINAAYVNFNQKWKKFSFVYGLRAEMTQVSGEQMVYQQKTDTTYFQLFPSASLNYRPNDKHSFDFNLSRRIDRPGYDQLNPFKFYLDPSTYKEGNPYLGPQTTYAMDFGYGFKENIYASFGFAQTTNNIVEIIAPLLANQNITVQTNRNLASTQIYYFNLSVPFTVKKWWTSQNDLNSYRALYSGNIANTQLQKRGSYNFNINTVNTFQVAKNTTLELTGHYRTREIYAFDSINRIWFIGFGVQQRILKNNGTIKLSVTDLCFSNKVSANVHFTDYHEYFLVSRETRVATLAFTYRFGNKQVQAARRRTGGAEDLKQRVNGQGNG